ncbi:MAG: YtxH domain-containing protein [Thermodesulfobacteriota bacterium]|nr:MAG: YtxH domain-containing protein [Thermodesulfobacteriota bacterium]
MSSGKSNTLLAFLLGGVVGAGLALLYAPEPGTETRRKMKEGMEDAGDWAMDRYDDAREAIDTGTDKVKNIIREKKGDIRSAYDTGKDVFHKRKETLLKEEST